MSAVVQPVAVPQLRALPSLAAPRHLERPDVVAQRVCERYGVTFDAVAGWARTKHVATARRAVVQALRARTAMSTPEIGAFLGGRDHTTILHLARRST